MYITENILPVNCWVLRQTSTKREVEGKRIYQEHTDKVIIHKYYCGLMINADVWFHMKCEHIS